MSEQAAVTKTSGNKGKVPVSSKPRENLSQTINSPAAQMLHLQQTIGNQAVRRLINSGTLQAKLTIGKPNDKYEQEADRVADGVMSMPEPNVRRQQITPLVQRQAGPEEEEDVQRQPGKEVEDETIQHKGTAPQSQAVSPTIESRIQSFKGGGQPLSKSTREYFEPRFDTDFSQVRVHEGSQAAETAKSINAKAFTTGRDVVFGAGQYSPGTSSGKQLLAHELTHVVQQGGGINRSQDNTGSPPPITTKTGPGIINRWNGNEHKAFGDLAGRMAAAHKNKFTIKIETKTSKKYGSSGNIEEALIAGASRDKKSTADLKKRGLADKKGKLITADEVPAIHYGDKNKTMTPGTASELAGDHRASVKELKEAEDTDTLSFVPHAILAATNINHFFPLAAPEWREHHKKAIKMAKKAKMEYGKGKKNTGDKITKEALQNEAFGLHFLQDSYASGHQYPRALNQIDVYWETTAIYGYFQAKDYHDELCKLKNGLDLEVGGKFHGDGTADSRDHRVAVETYNSFAEVLCAISGKSLSDVGAKPARPNRGPDVEKIMKDPEAKIIWYALEHSLNEYMLYIGLPWESFLENARDNKDGTVTTDAGSTFKVSDIILAWQNRKGGTSASFITEMLMMGQEKKNKGVLEHDADDNIIDTLTRADGVLDINLVPPNLNKKQVVKLCKSLISGACIGTDEHAVLLILKRQPHNVFQAAVAELTPDYIDKGLDGDTWDIFLLVCANRYQAGKNLGAELIFKEKNDDAARLLVSGGYSEPPLLRNPGKFSYNEWIGAIKALLDGRCGGDDERAIIEIVKYLVKKGQADLIHYSIGPSDMDSGVDGDNWKTVVNIMNAAAVKAGSPWRW